MAEYVITCTSTCDLTKEYLKQMDIGYAKFKMIVGETTYDDDFFSDYPYEKFYDDISNGMQPTTSQVGFGAYEEFFESYLKQGKDVLHICLSSGISGDYSSCASCAKQLNEKYENKVYVVDSLGASSGYGMLVEFAYENKQKGMSINDNVNWLNDNKLNIHHWFISTDLSSYVRGGRISKTAGFFGSALKICPLMNVDKDGKLNPLEKIRTKSKALQGQLDKMIEHAGLDYAGKVSISVSKAEEDGEELKKMILDTFKNVKEVNIYKVGTTIGAHTGPGTIALYFVADRRV